MGIGFAGGQKCERADMRKLTSVLALTILLAACAIEGRVYDRQASDAFRIGVTTADEAMTALGEPDMDIVRPSDGVRILRWRYRRLRGISVDEHVLSANFDNAGLLVYLHNPEKGQNISPF